MTRGEQDVREFFEAAGSQRKSTGSRIRPTIRSLPPGASACEVGQIAKTILFLVDADPVVVVVISGDRRVDMKKVRALGHGKRVRLAGPGDVVSHTGFAVGAVSPVPLPPGVAVYLDRSLRRFEVIYPAAGETNSMFSTTPDELLALTGGREADLARDDG